MKGNCILVVARNYLKRMKFTLLYLRQCNFPWTGIRWCNCTMNMALVADMALNLQHSLSHSLYHIP